MMIFYFIIPVKVMIVDKRKTASFAVITFIIGFMLAVQFQSVNKPEARDTRDTWELRADLQAEKETQSNLLRQIRANEKIIAEYETEQKKDKETILKNTLEELKKEAGLTELTGPGIKMEIQQLPPEFFPGEEETAISADLLRRLLNEVNMYGAKHISIGGERIINTTVIREISGETKINGKPLVSYPIEIIILTEDFSAAKELYNRMEVSQIRDELFIENFSLSISEPETKITVPAYDQPIRMKNIEAVMSEEGAN